MANIEGIITEDIRKTISPGQKVYDNDGKQSGTVDLVDRDSGYFMVQKNPFSEKDLYVPFRLITNIDPRELYVSVSRDELYSDYANPPSRSTFVAPVGGEEVATTTEPSGYTGGPIVVERATLDEFRRRIAVDDHVYTTEMTDLGAIKRYDPTTGWMLVQEDGPTGMPPTRRERMIPVTVVSDVNTDTHEVYLSVSSADLDRMKQMEPADVVFVEASDSGKN